MERHTNRLTKRLLEIAKEVEEDAKLRIDNINQKALACAGIKTKWVQILFEESKYLDMLTDAEEKLTKKYIDEHGAPNIPKLITTKESECNEDIQRVRKAIKDQKEVVRYIDMLLKNVIAGFGYDIKNSIDAIKIENM